MTMNFANLWLKCRIWFSAPIAWVWVGGLILRVYSAGMRTIINPDGSQYIYQASAIFNQDWSALFGCKLSYLSPLPIAISTAFIVCRDWVIAAQMVNVLFGWGTLFPLYHILRRFVSSSIAAATVLIYALMPVMVDGSGNVIRGPMFWFFAAWGLLFFVRQWDVQPRENRFRTDLLASMMFFLLAVWCRIEGVVFFAAPAAYLVFTKTDRKIQRCLFFLMPIIFLGLIGAGVTLSTGADISRTIKIDQLHKEATHFVSNYQVMEDWINETRIREGDSISARFLHRARETLMFIPMAVIFQNILEGMFYPFALIFLIGIFGIRHQYHQNRRMAFLVWQVLAGVVVLYIHTIQTWIVSYRFLAIIFLPGCMIMACGIEKTVQLLQAWRRWPATKALTGLVVVLIIFGLGKNLRPEERDKLVYRQAARLVVRQGNEITPIAGYEQTRALEWILLYSHRDSVSMPCTSHLRRLMTSDYDQFVKNLDKAGIRHLLYEERYWPHDVIDLPSEPYENDFRLLGQWKHSDSKRFMLLERL